MVAMSNFDLRDRVVLLTGASGHLGTAMSRAILRAGADLIISGRREVALTSLRDQLDTGLQERCHTLVGDIGSPEGVQVFASKVSSKFASLHGIVNNAYHGRVGNPEVIGSEDFLLACQLNMVAPFLLTRQLLPLLEKGAREVPGGASIVNVASMYGSVSPDPSMYGNSGNNNPAHYGATKAGLIQLTRYLACHFGVKGIRANSISPGPFPKLEGGSENGDIANKLAARVPLGRIGKPTEVAGPVVFLLSHAASYVNGANIPIDGGWTAW